MSSSVQCQCMLRRVCSGTRIVSVRPAESCCSTETVSSALCTGNAFKLQMHNSALTCAVEIWCTGHPPTVTNKRENRVGRSPCQKQLSPCQKQFVRCQKQFAPCQTHCDRLRFDYHVLNKIFSFCSTARFRPVAPAKLGISSSLYVVVAGLFLEFVMFDFCGENASSVGFNFNPCRSCLALHRRVAWAHND